MKIKSKIRSFLCDKLDWHRPGNEVGFDGASFTCTCKYCNRHILRDSQGNWFSVSKY